MAPTVFHHPFQPYSIQQQFMAEMYDCIEDGKVGLFESPTGTGKSLSLICSSLTWLRDHKRRKFKEIVAAVAVDDDEPEWMVRHATEAKARELRQTRSRFEARLQAIREREQKIRDRLKHKHDEPPLKRRKIVAVNGPLVADDDEQFMLADYDSDSEDAASHGIESGLSKENQELMEQLGMLPQDWQNRRAEDERDELKVFFCSRTHSQLTQFVGELQRVRLPSSVPPEDFDETASPFEDIKSLSLGSRKNLCINSKVAKLSTHAAVNERCIELQQSKTPAEHKCPFAPNRGNEDLVLDFRDHALAKVRDIEDLAILGSKIGICPYYASRPAIDAAEMVTLPYPLLLQKSSREAFGISLKDHVVVIDEAHNLITAVEGIYSTQVSDVQLSQARAALRTYVLKFSNRLKGRNRMYLAQVVRVVDALIRNAAGVAASAADNATGGSLEPAQLLSGRGVDQLNLAKIVRYMIESRLARKVEGYAVHEFEKQHDGNTKNGNVTSAQPTLTHVQDFLLTLMNPSKEGQFFWERVGGETIIRYMLLDPAEHFREIVDDARAVILAGGTMSPLDDFMQRLFPYAPPVVKFSCGHLIPARNLLVRTIATDHKGDLDLLWVNRNDQTFIRLGMAIQKVAREVAGGMVVFFPSYVVLEQAQETWRDTTQPNLEKMKAVFWDSRNGSAEDTFKAYSKAVPEEPRYDVHGTGNGAILFSVLGGKLSEGINFADNLGRCVVVVGLPFPNLQVPEWKAKLRYIDEKATARGEPGGKAAMEHAENVCMRNVNQAIGRVIRHKDDWASIVLIDRRYKQERIRAKLPGWIRESFPADSPTDSGEVVRDIREFFKKKDADVYGGPPVNNSSTK